MPTLIAIPFQETQDDIFARMDSAARYAALSHEEKRLYDYELKKSRDRASELSTALNRGRAEGRAEGLAEGRAEGLEEGRASVALKMKEEGIEVAMISKFTGLSPEEIANL